MPLFRKIPVTIEAHQWFKNGDHPEDGVSHPGLEGKIVRRYCNPPVVDGAICGQCQRPMYEHGWIDTLEGGHIVCPGDWIITGVKGEKYPCKPDIFERTYEFVGTCERTDPRGPGIYAVSLTESQHVFLRGYNKPYLMGEFLRIATLATPGEKVVGDVISFIRVHRDEEGRPRSFASTWEWNGGLWIRSSPLKEA